MKINIFKKCNIFTKQLKEKKQQKKLLKEKEMRKQKLEQLRQEIYEDDDGIESLTEVQLYNLEELIEELNEIKSKKKLLKFVMKYKEDINNLNEKDKNFLLELMNEIYY